MADSARTPGRFVWREIYTRDSAATERFYGSLLGWTTRAGTAAERPYTMFYAGNVPVAGIMGLDAPGMEHVPPHWLSYVSVSDIDAVVRAAKEAGGRVPMGPLDIGIGRMAVVIDPEEAAVAAWQPAGDDPPMVQPPPGTFCWESLNAGDTAAARTFYEKVFGWSTQQGDPQTWVFTVGELQVASMHPVPPGVRPAWLSYVLVEDYAAARAKAATLGATVLIPDVPVPGLGRFAVVADPTGAVLALFQGQ